jgi:hypothetical protein
VAKCALTRGWIDGAAQFWTFCHQNCELNKPLFLTKYPASGILLQQQKYTKARNFQTLLLNSPKIFK